MRLYDVILEVVRENSARLDDVMERHRLVEALTRELSRGRHGWVAQRVEKPKRSLFRLRRAP